MAGCRSLTDSEVVQVMAKLNTPRDKALFIVGLKTGYRISELLSLTVQDVYSHGRIVDRVKVAKRHCKGKSASREVVLHPDVKAALLELVRSMSAEWGKSESSVSTAGLPLFKSQRGVHKPLSRHGAHKVLKDAYRECGLLGTVATHSLRKSFSQKIYKALKNDLLATKEALGHSDIRNTIKYLEVNQSAIDAAILAA